MIQNLIWATSYNVVAIPLAAGFLYSSGFNIGAEFMSLSTIIATIMHSY